MCAKRTIHAKTRVRETITIFMKKWCQKDLEEVICVNLANNCQIRMISAIFFFVYCGSNNLSTFMLNWDYIDSQIDFPQISSNSLILVNH